MTDTLIQLFQAIQSGRSDAIDEAIETLMEMGGGIETVASFAECGFLTRDDGLVIQTRDGAEFQITIKAR